MDLTRLSERELAPVYILVSSEPLLVARAVERLRELTVPPETRSFNYDVLEGRGASAAQILAVAQTMPMMARRRLVEVRDFGALKAADLAGLVSYLSDPNPTTTLLAVADKIDKRIKFFQAAKKKGFIHELEPPKNDRGLISWARDEAKDRGISIDTAALSRLVDVVGKDLSRLSGALEQLSLYVGDGTIAPADVDELIADTRERSVFELTDAIGDGDQARALTALASLTDQRQSAIGVVMMLARHMRQLLSAHEALRNGLPRREMPRVLGVPPFAVDRVVGQARRFSPDSVSRALCLLADADFALKGGQAMVKTLGRELADRIVLDRVVDRLLAMNTGSGRASSRA